MTTTTPKTAPVITIRHPRKAEFKSALALNGETAQAVLSRAIDQYLDDQKNNTDKKES